MTPPRKLLRVQWARRRRWVGTLLQWLRGWNRHQVGRIVASLLLSWLLGGLLIHLAESESNPDFATWIDSFWNVWVILFSGIEHSPRTAAGRFLTMLLLILGVGLASLFTASVASIFLEQYLRRSSMATFEMENHLVLCNWSMRGVEWIRQVHAKTIQEKRPVVIIHDTPDSIELPDRQDEAAFDDVYIISGDPTSETALRRARVARAHSVVILNDDREGKYADGKSILTCIAIRNLCRGENQAPSSYDRDWDEPGTGSENDNRNRYAPFVKRYPITSLVAGFGAGFSLGVLAAVAFRRQEPAPWFQRLSPASLHDLSEALRNLPAKAAGYIPDPAGWR